MPGTSTQHLSTETETSAATTEMSMEGLQKAKESAVT